MLSVVIATDSHLTQSAMGETSEPCCMRAPMVNQKEFRRLYCMYPEVTTILTGVAKNKS